jgi:hypothetical protein
MLVFQQLPHLRPSVLYVFGELSFLTDAAIVKDKMENTGSGVGGSGGVKEGRVTQVTVMGTGHLIPMEKVEESATHAATWIGTEMLRWRANEKLTEEEWGNKVGIERSIMSERFVQELKASFQAPAKKANTAKL